MNLPNSRLSGAMERTGKDPEPSAKFFRNEILISLYRNEYPINFYAGDSILHFSQLFDKWFSLKRHKMALKETVQSTYLLILVSPVNGTENLIVFKTQNPSPSTCQLSTTFLLLSLRNFHGNVLSQLSKNHLPRSEAFYIVSVSFSPAPKL